MNMKGKSMFLATRLRKGYYELKTYKKLMKLSKASEYNYV